jgi:hypothetical protein
MIKSMRYVGLDGPIQSVRVINTTKEPTVAINIVKNRMTANFWKNEIVVKIITVAEHTVVKAAARMEGPIRINEYFVLSLRFSPPSRLL